MAVVYIQEFAYKDWSTANYDWAKEQIGEEPIDGLLAHTAGFDTDAHVFRIMDVWESREQAEHFIEERVQPLMERAAIFPTRTTRRHRRVRRSTSFTTCASRAPWPRDDRPCSRRYPELRRETPAEPAERIRGSSFAPLPPRLWARPLPLAWIDAILCRNLRRRRPSPG